MTIFLRSDIYTHIYNAAHERDKLDLQKIEWNDPEILKRVLDERLIALQEDKTPDELWGELFAPLPDNKSIKDFVIEWVRPRPRDAIYFVKTSLSEAVSRGHSRVEQRDLETARQVYSDWAFKSLVDEDDPEKSKMKDVVYEFLGEDKVLKMDKVRELVEKATGNEDRDKYVQLLFETHFLELKDIRGNFRIIDEEEDRQKIIRTIEKTQGSSEVTCRISKPYWAWFQFD